MSQILLLYQLYLFLNCSGSLDTNNLSNTGRSASMTYPVTDKLLLSTDGPDIFVDPDILSFPICSGRLLMMYLL